MAGQFFGRSSSRRVARADEIRSTTRSRTVVIDSTGHDASPSAVGGYDRNVVREARE
jgi:hypothetical protein